MGGFGAGGGSFGEIQQRMQREVLGNPDLMRQMLDNPLVQQMMNNPEYMRSIITSNPQMQQLMEVCFFSVFGILVFCSDLLKKMIQAHE